MPMKILVTGATGFVGQHLIRRLIEKKHQVIAIARDEKKAQKFDWYSQVRFISHDIHQDMPNLENWSSPKIIVHLAWSGLPNYQSLHHMEETLPAQIRFLKAILEQGVEQLFVTGTCFEFGKQNGPLSEKMPTSPNNPYAIAKDRLHKWLRAHQAGKEYFLQWVRLFFLHGPGQNPNSILSQLDRAINNGETVFNMSFGEQLRDYLPIEDVAKLLETIITHPEKQSLLHCCSGEPISLRRLVENHVRKRNASIKLNLGYYPYPDYEPIAFWGDNTKLINIIDNTIKSI